MNEEYEHLIADYLAGELDNEGKEKLESLIAEGRIDFIEFREVEGIHDRLTEQAVPKATEMVRERFYTMLENEKKSNQSGLKQWMEDQLIRLVESFSLPRVAYAMVLLFIGGFIGSYVDQDSTEIDQLSQEMQSLKEIMMVNMLEGSSAADRLKAVNISSELPNADLEAINALLFTLNNDPSVNVRVQTIEALKRWGDNERVRQGLVRSIATQESPIVLIELADAMTELEVRSSASEFEKILQERELDYNVQQKLQSSIAVLM